MNNLLISIAFVGLYGSGFVAAKLGMPYADPLSFLACRFLLSGILLGALCFFIKAPKPPSWKALLHSVVAGLFLIGVFSIGVFVSIDMGTPPATSSLIISFQPLLVALVSYFCWKETISRSQWLGVLLGLAGVTFVVFNKLGSISLLGFITSLVGLLGLTIGSLYQKRFCSKINIFMGGAIHSLSSSFLCILLLNVYKPSSIQWTPTFIGALLWMSIAVSVCALSLFYLLVRRMRISQVSSLFYLMPVSTLLLSLVFFSDTLDIYGASGILITSIAISLVNNVNVFSEKSREPLELSYLRENEG